MLNIKKFLAKVAEAILSLNANVTKLYTTNNLQNLKYINGVHSYGSGETLTNVIQDWIADGKITLDQAFLIRVSMGSKYWAVGLFYKTNDTLYGSCIGGNYQKVVIVKCTSGNFTETEL